MKIFSLISIIFVLLMTIPPFILKSSINYIYWIVITFLYILISTIYLKRKYK